MHKINQVIKNAHGSDSIVASRVGKIEGSSEKIEVGVDAMEIGVSVPTKEKSTERNEDTMDTDVEPEFEVGIIARPEEAGGIVFIL